MRFAPGPAKATLITVPSGPAKDDLPDTPLAWADFTSQFAGAASPSGGAIFVDPGHPDYPPTWLTRYYGPLCVGWPGVHAKTFEPGQADPAELSSLDPQDGRRSVAASRGLRCLWGGKEEPPGEKVLSRKASPPKVGRVHWPSATNR